MAVSLPDRVLAGAKNMLQKRGYTSFGDCPVKVGHAFIATSEEKMDGVLFYLSNLIEDVPEKIKNEMVQYLYFLLQSNGMGHAIVAYDKMAPQAAETLTSHSIYRTECFKYRSFLYDPTAHKKTPLHQRMTQEEIDIELQGIKPHQLPSILTTDAIVRFYDFSIGDIIRISRPEGPYYRLVIQAP